MRIGIDARSILSPEKGDAIGVGHYTYQLIRHLLELDGNNEYVLFFDSRVREKDVKKFSRPNTHIRFFPFSDYKKFLPGAYNEILGNATLQKEKLDVLHTTSHTNRIPSTYRGKTVATFHNMSAFVIPQDVPSVKGAKERAVAKVMARKADKIIVPSESLKADMIKYLPVESRKIDVIYSGLDKRFFQESKMDAQKMLSKYGIEKKYILFLGTLEPSKNVAGLLEAFAKFKQQRKREVKQCDYQLVLAGKKGWLAEEYAELIRDLKLQKDVVFTGYIIGDELVPLFHNAEFFIMPSFYEGFGMTVLEAFATQTPAIISNVASLPEIAGDAAFYINDPKNIEEIFRAMETFASDEALRNSYREKEMNQVNKFDWNEAAKKTLEVYKSLQ